MTAPIAVAACCSRCAPMLPGAERYAADRYLGIIHADHVGELQAAGWVLTVIPHGEPDDIMCEHYFAAIAADPRPPRSASTGRRRHAGRRAARHRRRHPGN